MIGIYKITNQINGKVYIGQSVNIKKRWTDHIYYAKHEENKASRLYLAIRKYGLENFKFEVLEECSKELLDEREIYWIAYFDSTDRTKGYNFYRGGQGKHSLYNYNDIVNLWNEGYSCQEIESMIGCGDVVITSALRSANIDDFTVRSREQKKNAFVACDIKTGKPLKIFYGMKSVSKFFTDYERYADALSSLIVPRHRRLFGYYWEYLNENNKPENELTDEEFLSYQESSDFSYSDEEKIEMSKKQRKVERPNREELKYLIRTLPFTQIGKMYGVSDNAVRKWCDFEKLPRKKKEINSYSDSEWEKI